MFWAKVFEEVANLSLNERLKQKMCSKTESESEILTWCDWSKE